MDDSALVYIEPELTEQAASQGVVDLFVRVRGMSRYRRPGVPPVEFSTAAEREDARLAGEQYAVSRQEELMERSAGLEAWVRDIGGLVMSRHGVGGTLHVHLASAQLEGLAGRPEVAGLFANHDGGTSCNGSCAETNAAAWRLGTGRDAERLDVLRFHAAGYTGDRVNNSRHAFGDIVLAVVEDDGGTGNVPLLEDEACFLGSSSGQCAASSPRIKDLQTCTGGSCTSAASFSDETLTANPLPCNVGHVDRAG